MDMHHVWINSTMKDRNNHENEMNYLITREAFPGGGGGYSLGLGTH